MKGTNQDGTAGERVDRLIDEELRAVLAAPPVDLRVKVLQAIDERRATTLFPRWAFALAASAVLVLAVVLTWRGSVKPGPQVVTASRATLASTPIATGAARLVEPSIVPASRPGAAAVSRRPRQVLVADTMPAVEDVAASNEPYLPGAPAGDLGDPLEPLPSPPPISFAPIHSAPPVSEFARPVTDFPADNPAPAAETGGAGPSGGTRR